jgi:hypothetical protein
MIQCDVRCSSSVSLSSLAVSLAALLCLFEAAVTARVQWTSNEILKSNILCDVWLTFL